MIEQQPPEMFSVALTEGNKVTVGFRRIPLTAADWDILLKFLELLKPSLQTEVKPAEQSLEELPVGTARAERVLRGHFPTETELAAASQRVGAKENFRLTLQAMEKQRLQERHSKLYSTESDDDSQP